MSTKSNPNPGLTASQFAERLMDLADSVESQGLEADARQLAEQLDQLRGKLARAGEVKLRILRAKSVAEAQAIRKEFDAPKPPPPAPKKPPAKKPSPATKPAAKKAAPAKAPAPKAPPAAKDEEPAAPLASVAALEQPATPIEPPPAPAEIVVQPQGYYDADTLGLAPAVLAEAMTHVAIHKPGNPNDDRPAPRPPRIGKVLKVSGRTWAVTGAQMADKVTYALNPVNPETPAFPALYEGLDDLVDDQRDKAKAPEDYELDGLLAVDPAGVRWVIGANEIYVRCPRDRAKEAREAHERIVAAGGSFEQAIAAGTAKLAGPAEDSHCNGKGEFVEGVERLTVQTLGTTADRPLIVIRVARGDDGLYRTGHSLAFNGAELWGVDSDEPVKLDAQAVGDRGYAIKTRALILITRMQAAFAATTDAKQRRAFTATIRKLQSYIDTSPNVNTTRRPAMAG